MCFLMSWDQFWCSEVEPRGVRWQPLSVTQLEANFCQFCWLFWFNFHFDRFCSFFKINFLNFFDKKWKKSIRNFEFRFAQKWILHQKLGSRTCEMCLEQILWCSRYVLVKEFLKSSKMKWLNCLTYRASRKVRPPARPPARPVEHQKPRNLVRASLRLQQHCE